MAKARPPKKKRSQTASAAASPAPGVRVRMFRQGLGDCFLLTFNPGPDQRHVLIDCGSLGATTTGVDLASVAREIKAATDGHLDLVVATHEHWDHVAGFGSQREAFAAMKVDHVWLAWTENPADADARALETYRNDLGLALTAAHAAALAGAGLGSARCAGAVSATTDIAGFGLPAGLAIGTKADLSRNLDAAMQFVRTGLVARPDYLNPGLVLSPDWLPGFRVYVLGPPRQREKLLDLGEHGSSEIYGVTSGLRLAATLQSPNGAADVSADEIEAEMPFESRFRWSLKSEEAANSYPDYFGEVESWRRVDGDWLDAAADAAEELALQLDSLTNNTSLALAFERVADGKVLLFPADAQEGNWTSWQDLSWEVRDQAGSTRTVVAGELLRRTVFYKVGHHASHNGTAKGAGLELMTDGVPTAFIPVDRKVALTRNPKDSWQMPARVLYRRLLEKCDGRVVRSDLGWAASPAAAKFPEVEKQFAGMATSAEWTAWGKTQSAAAAAKTVQISPQYVDFSLP